MKNLWLKICLILLIVFGSLYMLNTALAEPKERQKIVRIELTSGEKIEGTLIKYENGIWELRVNEEIHKVAEKDIARVEIIYEAGEKPVVPPEKVLPKEKPDDKELQAKITELIKKLGDDDWQTREEATKELEKIGRPALPALKKALKTNPDPEIKMRARLLVENICGAHKPKPPDDDEEGVIVIPGQPGPGIIIQRKIEAVTELHKTFEEALGLLKAEKYEKGIEVYQGLIKKIEAEFPGEDGLKASSEYNIACAYSRLKKADQAIEYLEKAIKDGFNEFDFMEKDADLDNIRDDPRYKKLVGEAEKERSKEDEEENNKPDDEGSDF